MKIAVITGASSGMGRQFVLQLAQKEPFDEIWVISRSQENLEALRGECTTPLRVLALDLGQEESIEAYSAQLAVQQPDIRVLVNCAGYGKFGASCDIPVQEQLGMIDLNCRAMAAMTMASLPYMTSGSKIVQVDSLSAFQPVPYMTVYGATKAFVLSYSRAMNVELASRGIRVMAVCPGWVNTGF
ncbi:MAG: SDR family NAD(P)-dependent oxidoreductase, partial [Clostridia bacterium]|nr:SDR family NAD(P)-dependent oxidoreductase [Clostridia bacterium]